GGRNRIDCRAADDGQVGLRRPAVVGQRRQRDGGVLHIARAGQSAGDVGDLVVAERGGIDTDDAVVAGRGAGDDRVLKLRRLALTVDIEVGVAADIVDVDDDIAVDRRIGDGRGSGAGRRPVDDAAGRGLRAVAAKGAVLYGEIAAKPGETAAGV